MSEASREPPHRYELEFSAPDNEASTAQEALMASVAELRAAIDAATQQVTEGQAAVRLASERLAEAQQSLAAALDGSGHDSVAAAQAALAQAALELEDCLTATMSAIEQAQTYSANL